MSLKTHKELHELTFSFIDWRDPYQNTTIGEGGGDVHHLAFVQDA